MESIEYRELVRLMKDDTELRKLLKLSVDDRERRILQLIGDCCTDMALNHWVQTVVTVSTALEDAFICCNDGPNLGFSLFAEAINIASVQLKLELNRAPTNKEIDDISLLFEKIVLERKKHADRLQSMYDGFKADAGDLN